MSQGGTSVIEQVLASGGEMGALISAIDWSETPVGPLSEWPQSLRTVLSVCLASRFPMLIWWGSEMIQFYNDAYRPVLGATKHPRSMGQRGPECWAEIWDVIGPMAESVWNTGQATWSDDLLLVMDRNRYIEETYFTFSYSPIRDESGGIGGILVTCTETTERVLGERRLRTLRDLGAQASAGKTAEEAARIAAEILAHNPIDLPFALLYLLETDGQQARLVGSGVETGLPISPSLIKVGGSDNDRAVWPLEQVAQTGQPVLIDNLAARFNEVPPGPWPEPTQTALVLPVAAQGQSKPTGFLVVGLNSRRVLDDDYRGFLDLVAGHIATAVANARAYEAERRRAEALAELDQAKTTFFSNISHEFRTPLTLLLGPLKEVLTDELGPLLPQQRQALELAQRNSLRLLKLVNSLLDFSRIEANRIQASFQPVDLAVFTADLASVFRSAVERAGLRLTVDCPTLPEPVYVDREMWEKIVLNLLSNAFKFTYEGEITVSLRALATHVELIVSDTGTGIPADELPHIFERFHRVRNARARTHEGTGIGLALVQELVHLHGGQIEVTSEVDQGTTFRIQIPTGTAHLPAEQIERQAEVALSVPIAQPYLEEALRWLPDPAEPHAAENGLIAQAGLVDAASPEPFPAFSVSGARILLVEDNADMRDYLRRLLAPYWRVETAANGVAALSAAREHLPDLILSDVMMPGLDGFGLLRKLRADPETQTTPIILLSARAGEEAIVEGMQAGADDYLVKPFSAQELLARVGAHLALAHLRRQGEQALRESEARFRNMADHAPVMIWVTEPEGACTYLSQSWYEFTGQTPETGLGFGWLDAVHPGDRPNTEQAYVAASKGHEAFRMEYRLRRKDGEYRWVIDSASPRLGPESELLGYIGSVMDIHERKRAEMAERLQAEASHILMTSLDYKLALTGLAQLVVSHLADWCTVNLVATDGAVHLVAAAHREPARLDLIYKLVDQFPIKPTELHRTTEVMRLGQAQRYPDFLEKLSAHHREDPEYRRLIRELGEGATMIAPLVARGRVLGTITFVSAETDRRYDEADLALAKALARQVAVALDNVQTYEAEQQARQVAEQTTKRITTLQRITAALSEALTPAQVADVVVKQGFTSLGAAAGWIALFDEDNQTFETLDAMGYPAEVKAEWRRYPLSTAAPIPEAVRTGTPVFAGSPEAIAARFPQLTEAGAITFPALAAVPLMVKDRVLGGMGLSFAEFQAFNPQDRAFILALAQQCAQALERARLYEVEQQARIEAEANQQRLAILAEMRERNRLAQELHDTVAQALGYLNLKLGMTSSLLNDEQIDAVKANLQELKQVTGETYTDVREEIFYLRAKVLSDLSFMELLDRYIDKYRRFYNLDIQLIQEADPALFEFTEEATTQLVRTIQEALINIRKHAQVNKAVIRLDQSNGEFRISIEDQGQGFNLQGIKKKTSSFGLQIMRERVEGVGGSLEIDTAPGQGTRIIIRYKKP